MVSDMEETWRWIYERYYQKTYSVSLYITQSPELAKDVTHDAFLEAFQNLHKLRDITKVGAWIAAIAINIGKTHMKRHQRYIIADRDIIAHHIYMQENDNREDSSFSIDLKRDIMNCLRQLPGKYQQVLILRYYYDLEYEAIAEVLSIRSGTVKSRLNRAHNKLKKLLEENQSFTQTGGEQIETF